jgi:Zn-dependent protease with chaperone function
MGGSMQTVKSFKVFFLIFGLCGLSIDMHAGIYSEELKQFKTRDDVSFIFEEDANPELVDIAGDIHTFKNLPPVGRLTRAELMGYGVLVTEDSMPKMYHYIKTLCADNNIDVPVVFISKSKNVFNAFALKLFTTSGGILIGQELLNEASDDEIEAIIAHEIGHVNHNHANKTLTIKILTSFIMLQVFKKYYPQARFEHTSSNVAYRYMQVVAFIWSVLLIERLVIGKKFEREADLFACQKAQKAQGLIAFFKRLQNKAVAKDIEFEKVKSLLEANKDVLNKQDYHQLSQRHTFAKWGHAWNKGMRWLYHNTFLGAHPSNEDRIAAAEKYLQQQNV